LLFSTVPPPSAADALSLPDALPISGRAGHPARPAAADAPAGAGAHRPGQGLRTSATGLPRRVLSAGTGLPRSSARRPASGGSGTLADPGAGAGDRPDP